MAGRDKLVVITRKTAIEELIERFNTRDQACFYIEHMGGNFASYQAAHETPIMPRSPPSTRPSPAARGSSGSIGRFCPHSPSGPRT